MGEFYQDKSSEQIKKDVSEQFKKDDKYGLRDDREIYMSAQKVINKYLKEIEDSKKESFGPRATKEFTDLKKQLSKEMDTMTGRKYFTENAKTIHDIANRIDNAEKFVLEKLALNRSNAKTINAINASEKTQNKKYFNRDGSGVLTFTSEVNKPTIHEVLGNVFKNNTDVYKIDYSGCTNQNIKNKMSSLGGNRTTFYISYDQEKKTYLLSDSNGNKIDQRALIREGVKLSPSGIVSYQAKQENRRGIEEQNKKISEQSNLGNKTIAELKVDPKRGAIINSIPSSLKTQLEKDQNIYKDFLSKTEKRLDEIIKDAKSKNRELHTEPISKVGVHRNGLMEVHLISGTAEKDVILRNDANHLGNQNLYNLLDGQESGYKQYLTSRIQQKRHEYDHLSKQENIINPNKEVKKENLASQQDKVNAIYGLGLMGKLIDKLRDYEGNTRKNNDDRKITDMVKYIRDAKYSIQTNENISKSDLQSIATKLKDLFNVYNSTDEKYFTSLISGPKDVSIQSIRKIGEGLTVFDNTHTTFLRDEIIENDDLEIKETEYNNCFKKIGEIFSIPEGDGEIPENIKANIDELYTAANSSQGVLDFLKSKGMLPSTSSLDDKKVKEGCDKIYNTIQSKNQIINNFDITAEYMRSSLEKEKIDLESKDNKTSDDVARLNAILFLIDNPDALQEQAKNQTEIMKNVTKYAGIDSEIKGAIGSRLIKKGGGISGTNADIYNDSIGAGGLFDRSDENVVWASDLMKQIAIEVAICVVAIAAGAFTFGAGTAAIYGARAAILAARIVSAASKGGKILKIMKLATRLSKYKKFYKIGKITAQRAKTGIDITRRANAAKKATKLGRFVARNNPFTYAPQFGKGIQTVARGTGLLLEGTTFHLSSTIMHNAVDGKMDLFEGTDPTGYMVLPDGTQMPNRKSYAQSIAFLGVLKAVGQPVQELTKAGLAKIMSQKATASMMGRAVQSMGSFTGEVGTLMGTEQVLSLTFDQKLSPLTWEGFIHTIGMVAGLRGYHLIGAKIKNIKQGANGKPEDITMEVGGKDLKYSELIKGAKTSLEGEIRDLKSEIRNKDRAGEDVVELEIELRNKEKLLGVVGEEIYKVENNIPNDKGGLLNFKTSLEGEIRDLKSEIRNKDRAGEDVVDLEIELKNKEKLLGVVGEEIYKVENNIPNDKGGLLNFKTNLEGEIRDLKSEIRNKDRAGEDVVDLEIELKNKEKLLGVVGEGIYKVENIVSRPVEVKPVEVKVEAKPEPVVEVKNGNSLSAIESQITYLETQRAEMEKNYNSKTNKTPDDINTFNQNMDAFKQKIEALKVGKAKLELQPSSNKQEVLRDENNKPIIKEDLINLDEPITSPTNRSKLEKLIIKVENDNTISKSINREKFVLRGNKEQFDIINRKLLDGLQKTLIKNGDLLVSKRGERFQLSVDQNGKAFLLSPNNANIKLELTESMLENYKVIKRAKYTGSKGIGYYTTKGLDFFQKWPILGLSIKFPRMFIKTLENTNSRARSFFEVPSNPDIIKINKYDYIFRERTLGNNPQDLLLHPKQKLKKGAKSTFNVGPSANIEFSETNRLTLKNIKRTGMMENDLVVDKNGNEYSAKIEGNDIKLYGLGENNFGNAKMLTENNMSDYRVVRREGSRNLRYINGRIADLAANNIPGANLLVRGKRGTEKGVDRIFRKNKRQQDYGIIEMNFKIDPKIVEKNANLDNIARINEAKKLLGVDNIDPKKVQAILDAHNQPGKIYQLRFDQLRSRVEILKKSGFSSEQIKILLENGICGRSQEAALYVNKNGNIDTRPPQEYYIDMAMQNLSKTSRTANGIIDASASANKQFKFEIGSGDDAGIIAKQNFKDMMEFAYANKDTQFQSPQELKIFIEKIAKDINKGIFGSEYFLRNEPPKLKSDGSQEYPYSKHEDLPVLLEQFSKELFTKFKDPNTDPYELAAWVEYRINLKDHFFADGCGKTSSLLSNFILMKYGKPLPEIRSRKEGFSFTGKTIRDVNKPDFNPELDIYTNYYKTLFIKSNIEKFSSNINNVDAYINQYNANAKSPFKPGSKTDFIDLGEILPGQHFLVNENGLLKRAEINSSKEPLKETGFLNMTSAEIMQYTIENKSKLIEKYQETRKLKGEEFVVDVDVFREFLGGKEGLNAQLNHEPSSYLADEYFKEILEKNINTGNKTIRFIMGGAGSGKSLADNIESNSSFSGAWDGTMKTYDNAIKKIQDAEVKGYDVKIDFIFRGIEQSYINGVLKRAIEGNYNIKLHDKNLEDIIEGKHGNIFAGKINSGLGRTVPLKVMIGAHQGSRETAVKLYNNGYGRKLSFYTAATGNNNIGVKKFETLKNNDMYDRNKMRDYTDMAFNKGLITQNQYKGLLGLP